MAADLPAAGLLRLPVRLNGIDLGRPVDVVLDLDSRRAIGLEVLCRDEALRYLPLAAAAVHEDEIAIASPLVLFEERDLAWCRRRSTVLGDVRGTPVADGERELGALADVVLAADGAITGLLVERAGDVRLMPVGASLTIAGRGSASAA
jgi:hypothetical protein